jgi:ribosomal protein L29
MKVADIAAKTDKELVDLISDSRRQVSQLVLESRTKEAKNVKAILAARKQLARALTIHHQRQLGAEGDK